MIEVFHEGDRVLYKVAHNRHEHGTVTAVGEVYIHVLYDGDMGSKATVPEDLIRFNYLRGSVAHAAACCPDGLCGCRCHPKLMCPQCGREEKV